MGDGVATDGAPIAGNGAVRPIPEAAFAVPRLVRGGKGGGGPGEMGAGGVDEEPEATAGLDGEGMPGAGTSGGGVRGGMLPYGFIPGSGVRGGAVPGGASPAGTIAGRLGDDTPGMPPGIGPVEYGAAAGRADCCCSTSGLTGSRG